MRWLRHAFVGGYRRDDVTLVLDNLGSQLKQMAESLNRVWLERERLTEELADARAQLEHERTQNVELTRSLEIRGLEIENAARARSAQTLAEAEEQAERIRHDASLRVRDSADRLEDLLRVREQLLGELRGILDAYGGLLQDVEGGRGGAAPGVPAVAAAMAPTEAGLYSRHVEIDAGPFSDFAELAAFERSLAQLPKVEDVHIKRFAGDRAAIELELSEETPLVHDLAAHLPYAMDVHAEGDDSKLVVDVRERAAG